MCPLFSRLDSVRFWYKTGSFAIMAGHEDDAEPTSIEPRHEVQVPGTAERAREVIVRVGASFFV